MKRADLNTFTLVCAKHIANILGFQCSEVQQGSALVKAFLKTVYFCFYIKKTLMNLELVESEYNCIEACFLSNRMYRSSFLSVFLFDFTPAQMKTVRNYT